MLKIQVPMWAREHFWDESPAGHIEFWAFRKKPDCQPGERICFYFDQKLVAQAKVHLIEPPSISRCKKTGKFLRRWKVFWKPENFQDLR